MSETPFPTPAHRICQRAGGVKALAALADRDLGRVYRWLRPRKDGGTGGRIPAPVQDELVASGRFKLADFLPADGEAFL